MVKLVEANPADFFTYEDKNGPYKWVVSPYEDIESFVPYSLEEEYDKLMGSSMEDLGG